jgi:4-amino-4-deoxy-L-arabinose transferase-like glycosyltransferase
VSVEGGVGAARAGAMGPMKPLMDDRRLLAVIVVAWVALTAGKLWLAANINVIWEEGHFALAGLYPALGYPDVPAGWPLFARLCTSLFGWSPMALRVPAVVVAQMVPLAIYFLAVPLTGKRGALWAALLSMLLPPLGCSGPLYYPEATLQLLLALMLGAVVRAQRSSGLGWWVLAGVCGGLGLFTHYRFAAAGLGVLLFALATAQGRRLWRRPGFWIAGALAFAGLVPSIVYNIQAGAPALSYHLVGRHEWKFSLAGPAAYLGQQIGICTPVFFVGLLFSAVRAARLARLGDERASLLVWTGGTIFLAFALYTPFAPLSYPQWPFAAYVALIPFLPGVFAGFVDAARTPLGRKARAAVVALGPIAGLLGLVVAGSFLVAWTHVDAIPVAWRPSIPLDIENWAQFNAPIARAQARAQDRFGAPALLASSGHVSATRLEFPGVPGRRVFALGEPSDAISHVDQFRAAMRLDRAALIREHAGAPVVLILPETTYLYHTPVEADFRAGLCGVFGDIEPFAVVEAPPGHLALDLFTARVAPHPLVGAEYCPLLPQVYLARPKRAEAVKRTTTKNFYGMAASPKGVASVDILLDGRPVTQARTDLDPPGARAAPALAFDPDYPRVQFDFKFPAGVLTPGPHRVAVAATAKDGQRIVGADRIIYVTP